jgi:hypothetical protein
MKDRVLEKLRRPMRPSASGSRTSSAKRWRILRRAPLDLDLLEERISENGNGNGNGKSHKGRWMLILLALGGGAFAIVRRMRDSGTEWSTGSSSTGPGATA